MTFEAAIFWRSLIITTIVVGFSIFARFSKHSGYVPDTKFILTVVFGYLLLFAVLYVALFILSRSE